jgi:nucleoside-diphosphate-sugar epimerase
MTFARFATCVCSWPERVGRSDGSWWRLGTRWRGHEAAGEGRDALRELGCEPVVLDVYDAERLREAVLVFGPKLVMHRLTDLPSDPREISEKAADNARVRTKGTRSLIAAARAAAAPHFVA